MPAQHVAQQRAQVALELVDDGIHAGLGRRQPADDRALERDGVRDALRERLAVLGHRADGREPARQAA